MITTRQEVKTDELLKATRNDEDVVVNIMCESFQDDPHMKWMLGKSRNPDKLCAIMKYVFRKTMNIGDVYLSQDKTAVALWKSGKKEIFTIEYIKRNIGFLLKVGARTVIRILINESFTAKQYPKNKPFYHLYLIGVLPQSQGKGYASKLMNPVLNNMRRKAIPVYLETANSTNVQIYRKKGFEIYNTWFSKGFELYYMKA